MSLLQRARDNNALSTCSILQRSQALRERRIKSYLLQQNLSLYHDFAAFPLI